MSIWAIAINEQQIAVATPKTTSVFNKSGDSDMTGANLINTNAPAPTTTAFRNTVAGIGASIASSSHSWNGIWAHLPSGPALRDKPSKNATVGSNLAVCAQIANSVKFHVPAIG